MNVKQEPHDDEIQAMANKIIEAGKARMVIQQKSQQASTVGQVTLHSIVNDKRPKINNIHTSASTSTSTSTSDTNGDEKAIDEESVRGRFGWEAVGNNPIPYLIRSGEKYCAVRIVELKVIQKYLNYLHQDIYNCTCIRSVYVTDAECRLLNEINFKHCDYQYGRDVFTQHDLLVKLSDVFEFYHYLSSCYTKLVSGETDALDRNGFIRINKESVVPYTVYNSQKYVPLFYFEGETENLKQRANKLEGWDLTYLKFCCKVQGIRNELFSHDSCSVISLSDIKNYFPSGTLFEDYWPKKSADSQLLVTSGNGRSSNQLIRWTRTPNVPNIRQVHQQIQQLKQQTTAVQKPVNTTSKSQQPNQLHSAHTFLNYTIANQLSYHPVAPRTAVVRATYPGPNTNRHIRSTNYYPITQGPPPLVPTTQTQPNIHYNSNNTVTPAPPTPQSYLLAGDQGNLNHSYQEENEPPAPQLLPFRPILSNGSQLPTASYIRHQPPPTQRYIDANQNSVQREIQNNYGVGNRQPLLINQQPAHQQQPTTRTQPPFTDERTVTTNGQPLTLDNLKFTAISEPLSNSNHMPYKMQKAYVEGKMIPCINMKPFIYTELLITLPDFVMNFFNTVTVQSCQRVMKVLGMELYKPNNQQIRVLMESGRCSSINDIIPLVQVRNVIDYMPQLRYMLNVLPLSNKRPRNS